MRVNLRSPARPSTDSLGSNDHIGATRDRTSDGKKFMA
jgi:hypothetical protein